MMGQGWHRDGCRPLQGARGTMKGAAAHTCSRRSGFRPGDLGDPGSVLGTASQYRLHVGRWVWWALFDEDALGSQSPFSP